LTEELVKRGHEVTLYATENSKTKAIKKTLIPQSLVSNPDPVWWQPARAIWNASYLASDADKFNVIHTHSSFINFFIPFIKTPVVQTLHHSIRDESWRPKLLQEPFKSTLSYIYDQYSKVHYAAISKQQAHAFTAAKDSFFKNHTVVLNGIPVDKFSFGEKSDDYFLYIGYVNEDKGAHIAVRAAVKTGAKLIIAGNNYGCEKFFDKHVKPYLSDKIRYVGPVGFNEKVELYKNAKALLAPLQWDEPYGLTLAEAQASGTPVIAFRRGAAPEIIQDGKTGFIVDTFAQFVKAMGKIDSISRAMTRRHAEIDLDVSRMVDEYEALYYKLASKK
jgi:glycosyltransferase involved in cell wall biosynthesis